MAVDWPDRVRRALMRWRAAGLGPGCVVAVSGGSDSVGLLRVLHELGPALGLALSVAHLDHGVRGDAARGDAEFVAELANSLGLPFDLGHWRPARAGHFEADARRARYAWLAEIAQVRGASAVAVGHTRDDQAETILHRVLRGTGPRGLAGMPARRALSGAVDLVRPLLGVGRDEVRAYLERIGQPWRDDASNADRTRTRARIRHDLLPRLAAEYNSKVADALVRLGELAAASERSQRRRLLAIERRATVSTGADCVVLRRATVMNLPRFTRAEVLRLAWQRAGWPEAGMGARQWRRLAELGRRAGERSAVVCGIEVHCSPRTLVLRPRGTDPPPGSQPVPEEPVPLALPGSAPWPGGRVVATLDPDAPRDETLDLDQVAAPLCVRAPLPGDRFAPLGMDGQSTPLNDFFRGRRVAREGRRQTPVVCDRFGIVWVVGHRIADRVRLTEETERTVGLSWRREGGCD